MNQRKILSLFNLQMKLITIEREEREKQRERERQTDRKALRQTETERCKFPGQAG